MQLKPHWGSFATRHPMGECSVNRTPLPCMASLDAVVSMRMYCCCLRTRPRLIPQGLPILSSSNWFFGYSLWKTDVGRSRSLISDAATKHESLSIRGWRWMREYRGWWVSTEVREHRGWWVSTEVREPRGWWVSTEVREHRGWWLSTGVREN